MPLTEMQSLLRFEDITLGQIFRTAETFDYSAMDVFANLSGDRSAIHVNPQTAKRCGFPDRLQYGFLLASLMSRIVGTNFDQAVCAAVSMDFVKPVPANVQVDATAEVIQMQAALRSVSLKVTMTSHGVTVIRGKLTAVFLSRS